MIRFVSIYLSSVIVCILVVILPVVMMIHDVATALPSAVLALRDVAGAIR